MSDSQVSNYVAYWSLLSLCISSMVQPSGKLCGLSARYLQWLTARITLRTSSKEAFSLILEIRMEGMHNTAPPSPSWPRWLFFIMGTVPAAIKLASFSGTEWTKTWGMMFMSSFIIIELTAILGVQQVESLPHSGTAPSIEPQTQTLILNKRLQVIELVALLIAYISHFIVAAYAYETLWLDFIDIVRQRQDIIDGIKAILILIPVAITILTPLITFFIRIYGGSTFQERWFPISKIWRRSWFLFLGSVILLPRDRRNDSSTLATFHTVMMIDGCMGLTWFWLVHWADRWYLELVCRRWPTLSTYLLLSVEEPGETKRLGAEEQDKHVIGENEFLALSFFLTNLSVGTLWYAFKYDPAGTVNPSWTEVFG